jgi:hypothetical protein
MQSRCHRADDEDRVRGDPADGARQADAARIALNAAASFAAIRNSTASK